MAQVAQCYRQLPIGLAVTCVNGTLLSVVLWEVADPAVVGLWLTVLLAVTTARYLDLRAFRRAEAAGGVAAQRWAGNFTTGAAAAGVAWGGAAVMLFPPDSMPHQVVLMFLLGGMMAGAIPLLSPLRYAYPLFAVPVVVPIAVQMMWPADRIHLVMGLMVCIFGLAMLASSRQFHRLYCDAERLRARLDSSIEAGHVLERLVRLDALTGIANRRLFEEALRREWRRAERSGETLALVTADIDFFKDFNDHYGHPAGDHCLVAVAQAMQHALSRPADVVARIGGEEFAILLPATSLDGARAVAEQVRQRILALQLPHAASRAGPVVSASFGVAVSGDPAMVSAADLLRASDLALYEAKRAGRDRVAVYAPHDGDGTA
ncbi:MAG: GGDEF domain-containing protein [Rhodocyclaceae bacterium]|nr:GGDEF domain-containing protein [Rhodocyclaceae bacterium]